MAKTTDEILARVQEIAATVQQLGPLLVGTLMEKRNRKQRKDGSTYVSDPYFTFQYRDADGKRRWRRVPRAMQIRFRKLVKTGERYQALEREYSALRTELGMLETSKKND